MYIYRSFVYVITTQCMGIGLTLIANYVQKFSICSNDYSDDFKFTYFLRLRIK